MDVIVVYFWTAFSDYYWRPRLYAAYQLRSLHAIRDLLCKEPKRVRLMFWLQSEELF